MAISTNDKSTLLYKHYLGSGSTRVNREFFEEAIKSSITIKPENIWAYADEIPDGSKKTGGKEALDKVRSLEPGSVLTWNKSESEPNAPLLLHWDKLQLTKVDDGTDHSFILQDGSGQVIKNIIPFNYAEDVYFYHLYSPDGTTEIPFGVGDWVVDTYSGILTFYGEVPTGIDHDNPPRLSFWQYVAGNGFRTDRNDYEVAVLPINNFKIDANTTSFCVSAEENGKNLKEIIRTQTEKIEPNFINVYGFDGDDKNQGVALPWERVMPLSYSQTHDPVKGYDESSNSQIGVILSSKGFEKIENPYFEVLFVSQKVDLSRNYALFFQGSEIYIADEEKINDSTNFFEKSVGQMFKLKVGEGFIYARKLAEVTENTSEPLKYILNTTDAFKDDDADNDVTGFLVYWDSNAKDWLPFVSKESDYFDFGFPVVTLVGKIPVSMKLDTAALSSFDDIITPEYYGPRTAALILAEEHGYNIKSSDYVVKGSAGWRLDDVLKMAEKDFADKGRELTGTVVLREGEYTLSDTLVIDKDIVLQGDGNVTISGANIVLDSGAVVLKGINLKQVETITLRGNGAYFLTDVVAPATSVKIDSDKTAKIDRCSFLNIDVTNKPSTTFDVVIVNTFANIVDVKRPFTVLRGNTLTNLTVPDGVSVVADNYITGTLYHLRKDTFNKGNYIPKYEDAESSDMLPLGTETIKTKGRFPIFDKDDHLHQKYAEFAWPFTYDEKSQQIQLMYDDGTLRITKDGKLQVSVDSDDIKMADVTFKVGDNATDDGKTFLADKHYDENDTVTDVLADLWHEKADLTAEGKVPLQQLPDSVSYGGLLFVGNWSFQLNNGQYPTFDDVGYKQFNKDNEVYELQPGWFFIVERSYEDTEHIEDSSSSGEEQDNPVAEQVAVDGQVYTAGDWVVYSGKDKNGKDLWEKIDRAYSDPVYSPLPGSAKVPGEANKPWYWKNHRGAGALDLSNKTIIEAFKAVNDQLRKLEPKKPQNIKKIQLKLVDEDKIPTFSYRLINANGTRSKVVTEVKDALRTNELKFKFDDSVPAYKQMAFFGDRATVEAAVTNSKGEFISKVVTPITVDTDKKQESIDKRITISAAQEPMSDADHGESFWKGVSVETTFPVEHERDSYTFAVRISDAKVDGKDSEQFKMYNGFTTTNVSLDVPYFPDKLLTNGFKDVSTANYDNNGIYSSGIKHISFDSMNCFRDVRGTIKSVYDGRAPVDRLLDLEVVLNNNRDDVIVEKTNVDQFVSFDKNILGLYDLDFSVPEMFISEHFDKSRVVDATEKISLYATVYDLYGEPHELHIGDVSNLFRFDSVKEAERCSSGLIDHNSNFGPGIGSFGSSYDSKKLCNDPVNNENALMKIGRNSPSGFVEEYKWPEGLYMSFNNKVDYTEFKGQVIDNEEWATACFGFTSSNKDFLNNASGFTMELETAADYNNFEMNKFNGVTKDVKIECCLVYGPDGELDRTPWFDCNKPVNGFTDPVNFHDPVMYAGLSTATKKRVTFGHQTLTGDLYIRVSIKKGSDLRFTKVAVTEVI